MKEITRIHIAKTAYDIEIDAKKELEEYIKELEHYANDSEILGDIEIRITEILAEHGVAAGGVIVKKDVIAVREQLGEPTEFASETISEETTQPREVYSESRQVYRDEDGAVLGGVLAGLSRYFGVDPIWARLVFIVLLFVSFGMALLVYLILWLLIPPAETAAEKLRMNGKAVTLASIKDLAGGEERINERAQTARRILSVAAGSLLVLLAIAGLVAIVAAVFGVRFGPTHRELTYLLEGELHDSWWFMTMMGLFVLSGILFSTLCFILASAAFRRQWSKRVGITVVAIITAGILAFAGGIGTGMYGRTAVFARIEQLRKVVPTDLSQGFMDAKVLTINEASTVPSDISYEVSDKPYYVLDSLPGVKADISLSNDGKTIKVTITEDSNRLYSMMAPSLKIYGPALESINLGGNDTVGVSYYNENDQNALSIDTKNSGSRFMLLGAYETVKVVSDAYSHVLLDGAAIGDLSIDGGGVRAGGVRSLTVTQPDVCPAHAWYEGSHSMSVQGVSSGKIIYNGEEKPVETISNSCGRVIVGSDPDIEENW